MPLTYEYKTKTVQIVSVLYFIPKSYKNIISNNPTHEWKQILIIKHHRLNAPILYNKHNDMKHLIYKSIACLLFYITGM